MEFERLDNNVNGAPRYVTHFLNCLTDDQQHGGVEREKRYETALKQMRQFGGRKYNTKNFPGGIVFSVYDTRQLNSKINAYLRNLEDSHDETMLQKRELTALFGDIVLREKKDSYKFGFYVYVNGKYLEIRKGPKTHFYHFGDLGLLHKVRIREIISILED